MNKKDYKFLKKYDFTTVNGSENLIKSLGNEQENVLYYVFNEERFDIIHVAHIKSAMAEGIGCCTNLNRSTAI